MYKQKIRVIKKFNILKRALFLNLIKDKLNWIKFSKMSKLCAELELKLLNLETKIEEKKQKLNTIFTDQCKLLEANFNIDHLDEKHSNGLNSYRQELLNKVSF